MISQLTKSEILVSLHTLMPGKRPRQNECCIMLGTRNALEVGFGRFYYGIGAYYI